MSEEDPEPVSFWKTTLGLVTQVGLLLGAIAAIVTGATQLFGGQDGSPAASGSGSSAALLQASPGQSPSQPTRARWAAEVSKECRTLTHDAGDILNEFQAHQSDPDIHQKARIYFQRWADRWSRFVDAVSAVPAPDADEARVSRLLAVWSTAADDVRDVERAAERDDGAGVQDAIQANANDTVIALRLARRLGVADCSG